MVALWWETIEPMLYFAVQLGLVALLVCFVLWAYFLFQRGLRIDLTPPQRVSQLPLQVPLQVQ
jgi:hypothetical protein